MVPSLAELKLARDGNVAELLVWIKRGGDVNAGYDMPDGSRYLRRGVTLLMVVILPGRNGTCSVQRPLRPP